MIRACQIAVESLGVFLIQLDYHGPYERRTRQNFAEKLMTLS